MRCLLRKVSSNSVSTSSWPLRKSVRSPERNRFLANCCVMVEPPTTLGERTGGLPGSDAVPTTALGRDAECELDFLVDAVLTACCLVACASALVFFCQAFFN